jgi:hypothetical protein
VQAVFQAFVKAANVTVLEMANRKSKAALLPVPAEAIERRIYLIRGYKVMLDSDLADLYQVSTKRLNEQVKRNIDRFPEDFMFQLTPEEAESLRSQFATSNLKSQIATSNGSRGGRRTLPFVFTEHGVAMLSSILHSRRAVQMNILIVRAFVKLREVLASNKEFAARIEKLEQAQEAHSSIIMSVVDEIRRLKQPARRRKPRIGFVVNR